MLSKPITIDQLNKGGISDSKYSGSANSVARLVGWDLHSEPGLMKVRQALAKDSGATIDEFCKVAVETSEGKKYWFSSESGAIWQETGGTYTLAYTTTPETGGAACLGALEWKGWLIWATESRMHRIPINSTALADWATYAQEDTYVSNLDQTLGSTGDVYTLTTAVAEGATHRQTFTAGQNTIAEVGIHLTAVGTGTVTVTLHNAANGSLGTKTISTASLATGWNYFEFATAVDLTKNTAYHIHVHSSVADGTITTSSSEDLEDGYVRILQKSNTSYHPMLEKFGILYIGDGKFVHQIEEVGVVGAHTYSTQALDLPEPYQVKCLGESPFNLLIGTYVNTTVAKAKIFSWDTYSVSWTYDDEVPEVGINAFISADNYVFVHAGLGGSIYMWNGQNLELYKRVQGSYTPTATSTVHPNAVGTLGGVSLFGLSDGAGDPADEGVYVLGHYSRNYPFVHDLSFPISEFDGTDASLKNGIEIGAIIVSGYDVFVSWKSDDESGAVDQLNYSAKLDNAFFETMVMYFDRGTQETLGRAVLGYQSMPASCSFNIQYQANHAGSYTSLGSLVKDTDRKIYIANESINFNTLQVKVVATVNSNDSPDFETLDLYFQT